MSQKPHFKDWKIMLNINSDSHPELYLDINESLKYLNALNYDDFNYPEETTIFHTYSEIKNVYELQCIRSFLATQNLEKTKLILWSDYDISNNCLIDPYKDYIDMRIYNPFEVAQDTILENNHDILAAKDERHWLQSDLLRLVALHKFGGIWIDMDIVLLRDFKPIMDQEFLYSNFATIDHEKEGMWGTIMGLKQKSNLSLLFLEELIKISPEENTKCWGLNLFKKVYQDNKFNVLPAMFFNPEYGVLGWPNVSVKNKNYISGIIDGWFFDNVVINSLYTGTFSWHWHNSTGRTKKKPKTIQEGSKFWQMDQIIESKLIERGIL